MSISETFAVAQGDPDAETFVLRLYIAGQSPGSIRAIENLRGVCAEYLPGRHQVEVIDLAIFPKLARADEIIAVPTLVCLLPLPVRRVIGDLSDTERVLGGLQLRPETRRTS